MELLKLEDFEPLVGSEFTLSIEGLESVMLLLTKAVARPLSPFDGRQDPPPGVRSDPFSLFLTGPSTVPLPQRLYPLVSKDGRMWQIFLVPIAQIGEERFYQASFA